MMDSEEDFVVTPEMAAEATDRNDEIGRLIAFAFTFDLPAFSLWDSDKSRQTLGVG